MSLYNMLFGVNPLSDIYLGTCSLTRDTVGRFRDAYVEKVGDDTKSEFDSSNFCGWVLHVYTRNGGGNRQHYNDEKESGPDCDCTGCIANYQLPSHPLYMSDVDDDFDCTYATFSFQIPPQFWPFLEELTANVSPETKPQDRWNTLMGKLQSGDDGSSEVRNAMSVMQPVLDSIQEALNAPPTSEPTDV